MSIFKRFTEKGNKNQSVTDSDALDETVDLTTDDSPEIQSQAPAEIKAHSNSDAEIREEPDNSEASLQNEAFLTESLENFSATELVANVKAKTDAIDVTDDAIPEEDVTNEDKTDEPVLDLEIEAEREALSPRSALPQDRAERRVNLGDMRLDVTRITSDIESGEALYQRAQQRVQNLMSYVERAEVDFSLLDRLEPENRRLKSQKRALESEIETLKNRNSVLYSNLEDHKKRLVEMTSALDVTNAKMAKVARSLEDREIKIKTFEEDTAKTSLELERTSTELGVETRENKNLRAKLSELSGQIQDVNHEKIGLAKSIESLRIDSEDLRNSRDTLREENNDLRYNLNQSEKQNNQMKAQMVTLHEEIRSFKTQYEMNILSRDDRIIALEGRLTEINDKLMHKENIVESAARDVSSLRRERTAQALERERLEKTIKDQSEKLNTAHSELLKSKQDLGELSQRYRDVAAALNEAQHIRTAELNPEPDIHPVMDEDQLPENIGETKPNDDDPNAEIEDILNEYKTNLRL